MRGQYVLVSIIWGHNTWPLYGVEGWPPTRGFLSTILYGDAIGTKVSGRYRQGGRPSGVAVVSNPDPALFRSAGCIASPARGRKAIRYIHQVTCIHLFHHSPVVVEYIQVVLSVSAGIGLVWMGLAVSA